MNIVIIEDEQPNFDHLKNLINRLHPGCQIAGPLKSVHQVKDYLATNDNIDLIFADVRLQDGIVFDALDSLSLKASIIMVTAYGEYAVKAFKYNSIDYLMKPVIPSELEAAMQKALRLRQPIAEVASIAGRQNDATYRRRFLIQSGNEYVTVKCRDISCLMLDAGILTLYTHSGKRHNIDMTLDEIESQLDPDMFFRISRQCIINGDSVVSLRKLLPRRLEVTLDCLPKTSLSVSKERVSHFKTWLDR